MTQQILSPSIIAKEALFQLKNNCVMGNLVHRDYRKEFVKVGQSISIRKPVKFLVTDGATRSNQDVEEGNTSITIDKRKHVSWGFTGQDMTLSIEEYSKRYIQPAMIALANQIDVDVLALYKNVWNWVGTPGQSINSFQDLSLAPKRLDKMAVPKDSRCAVLDTDDAWDMVSNLSGLNLGDSGTRSPQAQAYREAMLGRVAKMDIYDDQNVQVHTTGTFTSGSTPLTNGANQDVAYSAVLSSYQQSLITDGWAVSTLVLTAGDVITLAGVNAVNPISKADLGFLQEFVVLSDATSDGSGNATLTISPPIITSGPYQTVSAGPGDGAAITPKGTEASSYGQNMAFHKNAFALVTVPLEMPDSAVWKARESYDGFSVRLTKFWDGDNDFEAIRCDVLYGVKAIYPDLATRASGTA